MATLPAATEPLRPDDATEELPAVPLEGPALEAPRRRSRKKQVVIAASAVVVAAGAAIGIWLGTSSSTGPGLAFTTQVVPVTTGTMRQTVATTGTIQPAQQASLNFGVSGTVTAVDVTVGQVVTAGQTLATVAPTALQATADGAQSSLTAAQAKLAADEADGASASQIQSDQAAVTSAQAQLASAQANVAAATLTSTIAGTVASVDLTVGQQVSGGGGAAAANSGDSSAQVTVISTDTFVVNATVDDTQVGQIAAGDQAEITPNGSSTKAYGTVGSVGMIATGSSGVTSFPVVIDVTGTPSGLHAGATADVSIIVRQLNDVVQVPTAAISYRNGHAEVTVVKNGKHVPTRITAGQTSGGMTQVTSGVTAGQKIVEREVTFTGNPAGGTGGKGIVGFPGGPGAGVHVVGPGPGGFEGGGPSQSSTSFGSGPGGGTTSFGGTRG